MLLQLSYFCWIVGAKYDKRPNHYVNLVAIVQVPRQGHVVFPKLNELFVVQ